MTEAGEQPIVKVRNELDRCFDECWVEHASDEPSHLFHYTSTEGLVGIVTSRTFFLSDMMASTDQTEIRYGIDILRETIEQLFGESGNDPFLRPLVGFFKGLSSDDPWFVHAICFCAGDDVLTQWRGYSSAGGCAIGVDFTKLKEKAREPRFGLARMLYASNKQREIIRRIISCGQRFYPTVLKANQQEDEDTDLRADLLNEVAALLFKSSFRFKHPAFSSENEWRLFTFEGRKTLDTAKTRFRARGNAIIPYVELSFESEPTLIRQIRCSPGVWSRSALYGVNQLAKNLGDHVRVTQSELPL
jgi:hypothetical protein